MVKGNLQQNNEVAAAKIMESDQKLEAIQQNSQAIKTPDFTERVNEIISDPNTSVRDSLRAKLALQEQEKRN